MTTAHEMARIAAGVGPVPISRILAQLGVDVLLDSRFAYHQESARSAVSRDTVPISASSPPAALLDVDYFEDPDDGTLTLVLSSTGGLSEEQLEEALRIHQTVLSAALEIAAPHHTLQALTQAQAELVLRSWNGEKRDYPTDSCVHELFEAQAKRTPDQVAVVDTISTLTYRELNAAVNRVAHCLRARDIGVGSVVAVGVDRDVNMPTVFLGILKAGAAYLPLDMEYPVARRNYMIEDAGASLVVSADDTVTRASGTVEQIAIADLLAQAVNFPDCDPGRTSLSQDLMYVIYTSGTTGTPKGVLVPHAGVANYLSWCKDEFSAHGPGGAAVFSSAAFDMIVPDLYGPLIMGGRVCMIEDSSDPVQLAERLLRLAPFGFLKLTPGQLGVLGACLADSAAGLAGKLMVGADAFPASTLRNWRRFDPATPVLNEYGPTEASVGNSIYRVRDLDRHTDLLPIGRPLPNTTMYVLDSALQPVPIGVPGDLYIGGKCVVRGYANRVGLTALRFVADPFATESGARMYRTGDVGRWLPDGEIEFLGRIDDQVKIRGFRVEPAEIEAVMMKHPLISGAVVTTVGDRPETLRLVGYYVAGEELDRQELTRYLGERLPEYEVPGLLVQIPAVPLNANGKVDRGALPDPGVRRPRVTAR
jgi:amino acid adenylation domain-containing protein